MKNKKTIAVIVANIVLIWLAYLTYCIDTQTRGNSWQEAMLFISLVYVMFEIVILAILAIIFRN